MSPLKKSNNVAARMGRWSASHWKTAVFGWIAFVILAIAAGTAVGTKQIDQRDANVGQAHKADQILKQAGFQADPQTEIILVQSQTQTIKDAAFRATIADAVATVKPFARHYKNLYSPLAPAHADQISADGKTAMVEFDMRGTQKVAEKRIDNPIKLPGALSFLAYGTFHGDVRGLDAFPREQWPDNIELLYYAFHIMAGLGTLFLALMASFAVKVPMWPVHTWLPDAHV